jgi:AcrR family transcriptional regulator
MSSEAEPVRPGSKRGAARGAEKPSTRDAVREESRAAFREAILGSAERVFGRLGFRDAKMADIAAEAGVAAGTLYNYFKNKDEVFASIMERGREQVHALFETYNHVVDPIERTRLCMRAAFTYLDEHGSLFAMFVRVLGVTEYAKKRACDDQTEYGYAAAVQRTTLVIREALERGQLRRDVPAEDLATMLMGMCDATIFAWTRAGCPPGLVAKADTLIELFLRGAQAP